MPLINLNALRGCAYAICFKIILVHSRTLLSNPLSSSVPSPSPELKEETATTSPNKVTGIETEKHNEEIYSYEENTLFGPSDKCAILVMSNQGATSPQSLLRKYRYNQNGELIPGSVQYFVKFPQNQGTAILVPLKDKAFSPSGGLVRYYKEVPPIPHSWSS